MRAFSFMSNDEEIKLITTVPKKYSLSLDAYLKTQRQSREQLDSICDLVAELCYGVADLGFCHLDLKFANVVLDLKPLEVRLIDFDPQYMRSIADDSPLLAAIEANLPLGATSCDVLRLFYVLLMLAWLALAAQKRRNRAETEGKAHDAHKYALLQARFARAAGAVRGPFAIFFLAPGLADSTLMTRVSSRMLQYNLADARRLASGSSRVIATRRILAKASKALKQPHEATAAASLRAARRRALLQADAAQREVLLLPLLSALQQLTNSALARDEALACGDAAFVSTSSSPGSRRRFQSEEYAVHCGTARLSNVRVLTYEDARPALLPRRLTPLHHSELERRAKMKLSQINTQARSAASAAALSSPSMSDAFFNLRGEARASRSRAARALSASSARSRSPASSIHENLFFPQPRK
jgi:hypothetical protein